MTPDHLILSTVDSPIGQLAFACDADGAARGVSFSDGLKQAMRREYPGARMEPGETPSAVVEALSAYFGGDRTALARIVWSLDGAEAGGGVPGASLARVGGDPARGHDLLRRNGPAGARAGRGLGGGCGAEPQSHSPGSGLPPRRRGRRRDGGFRRRGRC